MQKPGTASEGDEPAIPYNAKDASSPTAKSDATGMKDKADDADSDASSICISQSSTTLYEQEPYEDFNHKVVELCQILWPDRSKEDFQVERLLGGSSHRVIGVAVGAAKAQKSAKTSTVVEKPKYFFSKVRIFSQQFIKSLRTPKAEEKRTVTANPMEKYVLRIPRSHDDEEEHDFDFDSAILRFVEGTTDFDIPRIMRVDQTDKNPLKKPYVLQYRIPGKSLEKLWEELNHAQRLCIAKESAKFLTQLSRYTQPCGGKIDRHSVAQEGYSRDTRERVVNLHQFDYYFIVGTDTITGQPAKNVPPVDLVEARFLGWKAFKKHHCVPDGTPWRKLAETARKIQDSTDIFGPDRYYLCHGDFYPRNIMAQIVDDSKAQITGVLDWDTVFFGPALVALESPKWLWAFDRYMSGELEADKLHKLEIEEPRSKEDMEIKRAFEAGVDEQFLKTNSIPEVEVARWLWFWSVDGIHSSWQTDLSEEALREYGATEDELYESTSEEDEEEEGGEEKK